MVESTIKYRYIFTLALLALVQAALCTYFFHRLHLMQEEMVYFGNARTHYINLIWALEEEIKKKTAASK